MTTEAAEVPDELRRLSGMNNRDLLLEFIQWCVDNPALTEDMFVDPLVAVVSVDEFLNITGLDQAFPPEVQP